MISNHLPEGHIDRFNGVGSVDRSTNFRWELKEGNESLPVIKPGLANR